MILQPFGNFTATTNAGDPPYFTILPAASSTTGPVSPIIQTQPTNQYVIAPDPATFSIVANSPSDGGTLSYQWQKYVSGSWSNVGTNSNSYTTGSTSSGDNNIPYRCIVTNTKSGLEITLSGTAVDPEGHAVNYQWYNSSTMSSSGLNPSQSQTFNTSILGGTSGTFFLRATDAIDGVYRDSIPYSSVTINTTSQTYSNSAYLFVSFSPILPNAWNITSESPAGLYSLNQASTYGIEINGSAAYAPPYPEVPQDSGFAEAVASFPSQAFTTATLFFDSSFAQDTEDPGGTPTQYAAATVSAIYNNGGADQILFIRLVRANQDGTPQSHQISLDNVTGTKNLQYLKIRVTYNQTVGLGGVDVVNWKTYCSGIASATGGNPIRVLYTV